MIPHDSVAPQHRLLVLDIGLDGLCRTRTPRTGPGRIKWWKMSERKDDLQAELADFEVSTDQLVEAMGNMAVRQIHDAAEATVGKTKPG